MEDRDARRVREWFKAHGGRFGLRPQGVACVPVLNLGGFVNRSFRVHDGIRHLHVKLIDAENAGAARRWAEVHRRLERWYHAPALLGVVEGAAIAGEAVALIFEHIPGRPLDPRVDPAVTRDLLRTVTALHADAELQAALGPAPSRTCAEEVLDTYVGRFHADLDGIAQGIDRLDFLPSGFTEWARAEADRLAAAARSDPAFAAPAQAVVHGDLHGGNVLVGEGGRWWLLDWDDLHPGGDPAIDVFILLWPLLKEGRGLDLVAAAGGDGLLARLPLYRRAMLLDEVVDSLADWLESDAMPEHRETVRRLKRATHSEALALYRTWAHRP